MISGHLETNISVIVNDLELRLLSIERSSGRRALRVSIVHIISHGSLRIGEQIFLSTSSDLASSRSRIDFENSVHKR
jgi:hypothetical protein